MTRAIVIELRTVANVVAPKAAAHSRMPVAGRRCDRQEDRDRDDRDQPVVREVERELDRPRAGQHQRGRGCAEDRQQVLAGGRKNMPMTAGNSLSENACVSRRKWTCTTLSSATRSRCDHRPRDGGTSRPGRPPGGRRSPTVARAASVVVSDQTRMGRGSAAEATMRRRRGGQPCAHGRAERGDTSDLGRWLRMPLFLVGKRHGPRSRGSSPVLYRTGPPPPHHAGGMGANGTIAGPCGRLAYTAAMAQSPIGPPASPVRSPRTRSSPRSATWRGRAWQLPARCSRR